MLLLKFLGCMILAGGIEYVLWHVATRFFEWRFLQKAEAICMLYDSVYPLIDDNFNDDNVMKVSIKFEYSGCKIKFRNALEASLKIEMLIHRALKNYYIVRWLVDGVEDDSEDILIEQGKKYLEEICYEMRSLINESTQELQQKEL